VKIIIRGDSAYSREEIMAWSEDETDIALSDLKSLCWWVNLLDLTQQVGVSIFITILFGFKYISI